MGLPDENRHAVDADEIREQRRLAFHDGQSRQRPDVAKAQDGGPVGDDRDGLADAREIPHRGRILLDGQADARHAGSVDVPQNLLRIDGDAGDGVDLAATMTIEHPIRLAQEARRGQLRNPVIEAAIRLFVHLERQLPHRPALIAPQRGEVLDRQPRLGHHLEHLREAPGLMNRLDDQDLRNLHGAGGSSGAAEGSTQQLANDRVPRPLGQPIQWRHASRGHSFFRGT